MSGIIGPQLLPGLHPAFDAGKFFDFRVRDKHRRNVMIHVGRCLREFEIGQAQYHLQPVYHSNKDDFRQRCLNKANNNAAIFDVDMVSFQLLFCAIF